MIDPNLLLNDPDTLVAALECRGVSAETTLVARDALVHRCSVLTEVESLRAEMNRRSEEIGRLISSDDLGAAAACEALGDLKTRLGEREAVLRVAEEKSRSLMLLPPNLPAAEAPDGLDEPSNSSCGRATGRPIQSGRASPALGYRH